ncbi:MAG: hypothetical protein F4058_07480 [Rhodothermaceae bacterium]|nr:hypothetical protein [Rhodothermaceae bacterium]MYI85163.1 hypothetical protein [Rhodothermaceae bacterium]
MYTKNELGVAAILAMTIAACTSPQELQTADMDADDNPIVRIRTNYEIGVPVRADTGTFMLNIRVYYVENGVLSTLRYDGLSDSRIQLNLSEYIVIGHDVLLGIERTDFEHDLAKSDTLVLKTVEMLVHEATDAHIRFTVIEDGGLPWLRVGIDEHKKRNRRLYVR